MCQFPIPPGDESSAAVFAALRSMLSLHRELVSRSMTEKGVHPTEAFCLRMLAEHGGMSQSDLAENAHLSRPRVTAILQEFEKSGIVVRQTDEQDQRVTRVFLTGKGGELAQEVQAVFEESIGRTIGALSDEDRRQLLQLFGKLSEKMQQALNDMGGNPAGDSMISRDKRDKA